MTKRKYRIKLQKNIKKGVIVSVLLILLLGGCGLLDLYKGHSSVSGENEYKIVNIPIITNIP